MFQGPKHNDSLAAVCVGGKRWLKVDDLTHKAQCGAIHPAVRCVVAPNPSMMTQNGTNTYILGAGRVAVIDPGPEIGAHQDAILAALHPGESISHILVTHAHLDHSGLAPSLSRATDAPVYGFGPANSGRTLAMQQMADQIRFGGGEGVDHAFTPDITLADGEWLSASTWSVQAIHTPGHMGNHLCFAFGDILFSGDHVMGWSTTLISPPDGDMTSYMESLRKLAMRPWAAFLPGHGAAVTEPGQRLEILVVHRKARETAILAVLAKQTADIATLTRLVYSEIDAKLFPAAQRNVIAHLIDLEGRNLIVAKPFLGINAVFALA